LRLAADTKQERRYSLKQQITSPLDRRGSWRMLDGADRDAECRANEAWAFVGNYTRAGQLGTSYTF